MDPNDFCPVGFGQDILHISQHKKLWPHAFCSKTKEKQSILKLFPQTNHTVHTELEPSELQTTILIEDECIDTDEEPMLHSNNTQSETEHSQHTDEHPSEHLYG